VPARELPALSLEQEQRIAALRTRYQARFEADMCTATALHNYEYLDLLDRAWTAAGVARPSGGRLCDVGCASFGYASAMARFFAPDEMVGVDIEGYRLFKDGHTRIDYATGYLQAHGGRFVVADYADYAHPADLILAWFPFVTPAAILAWRLPLSLLRPERLFVRIYHNLSAGGRLVMVNHGVDEAAVAWRLCTAAKLRREFEFAEPGVFSAHRLEPAVLSCWSRL
jgi:hypothetical protein